MAPQSKGWPLSSKSWAQTRCVGSWLHLKSSQVEVYHSCLNAVEIMEFTLSCCDFSYLFMFLLLVAGTFPGANGQIGPGQAHEEQNGFPQLHGCSRPSRASSGKSRVWNHKPKGLRQSPTPFWHTFSILLPAQIRRPCGEAHVEVVEGFARGLAPPLPPSRWSLPNECFSATFPSVSRMIGPSPFSSPGRRWRCSALVAPTVDSALRTEFHAHVHPLLSRSSTQANP